MSTVTAADVRTFLLSHFADSLGADLPFTSISADFDLLTGGIIDSMGILEMIAALEAHFGVDLDLEALDPNHLTVLGPLCEFIAQCVNKAERRA